MNDEFGKKNNKIKRGYKRRMGESCVFFFILHYMNKNIITIFDEERKKFEEELSKQSNQRVLLNWIN